MSKIKRFDYCNCKVNASKLFNTNTHKIQKVKNYQKPTIKFFKNLALPISLSFFT